MILAFDVNETMLDLSSLDPHFERIFDDAAVLSEWFSQLLQSAMVATVTDRYQDFSTLAREALELTARRHDVELSEEDAVATLGQMRELEPHPDVEPALEMLREAGFRLVALTNSPYRTLHAQLAHAGIRGFFEAALSVDEVRKFKPHPEVYRMAAGRLGVEPGELRLIAAHNWDTTGAVRAGCRAAFVARPHRILGKLDEPVDIVGRDLIEVAEAILRTDRP
ncbi:MAG: haloacid dehalogenase type II [Acidobacteria bacterium]|nr:haloacid dehalogenase type II [Acidobacteriota bacterium]